jgi:hypothetical protein
MIFFERTFPGRDKHFNLIAYLRTRKMEFFTFVNVGALSTVFFRSPASSRIHRFPSAGGAAT